MPELTFTNGAGEKLVGTLEEPPAGSPNRSKCVVLCHGLYQHKNIAFLRTFGASVHRAPTAIAVVLLKSFELSLKSLDFQGSIDGKFTKRGAIGRKSGK